MNKETLNKRLSKKDQAKVKDFTNEDGLIDDCKFMLYFNPNYSFNGYDSVPCKSMKEAVYYVRNASKESDNVYAYIHNKPLRIFRVYVDGRLVFLGNGINICSVVTMDVLEEFKIKEVYENGVGETILC